MENNIKQIGERLKGLREIFNISAEEVAELCEVSLEHYLKIEAGEADPSVYRLSRISKRYGIDLDVLIFGEEPRMRGYYITRAGKGPEVDRGKEYKYQSLASGFRARTADPFMVTVEPKPDDAPLHKNSHQGQEFNMVTEGTLELTIGKRTLVLNEGDSVYFDATQPHCMRALNDKPVKFLAIIL